MFNRRALFKRVALAFGTVVAAKVSLADVHKFVDSQGGCHYLTMAEVRGHMHSIAAFNAFLLRRGGQ